MARFGDLVQTKRLITTLCARDNATVHLCVDTSLAELARLIYPSITIHSIAAHGTGLSGNDVLQAMLVDNRKAFAQLRSIDFETIFNLNFSPLNFRIAALFDSERVEGYSWHNGQEIIGLWPSMAMRWSDFRRIGINLVDFWGGYCPDMIAPDQVNPHATPKGNNVGVVLAGRESRRSLPVDVLAKVVATSAGSKKADKVFLLGGQSEAHFGQALIKQLPAAIQGKTQNLAGKTNWADLIDIVSNLNALLTPDTGTMHLAAHLGTPVTAFFLSSAWCFETGPYGKGHTVYQAMTECLPCLETQPCPYDVKCLNSFADPSFLRFMVTNKPEHAPANLIAFTSDHDVLGQTYTQFAGDDTDEKQRLKFRSFVYQHLSGSGGSISDLEGVFAQRVYRERDWITQPHSGLTTGI